MLKLKNNEARPKFPGSYKKRACNTVNGRITGAVTINIFACKCSGYSRAVFSRINAVIQL